ncbi:MAG: hypothetical protein EHM93_07935 [Bacteroidales bacterium]|nr:MAG: hypothetical protein EHM93_07935 [Bacteroidales bacterium]
MKKGLLFIPTLMLAGCSISKDTLHPYYRAQIGFNKGGITENTDFTKTSNVQPDAFTGATKIGFNASGHVVLPIKRNAIETGIDYMYNNQTFTFNDYSNGYSGNRRISSSQIMLPVTYNFSFFHKNNPLGSIQFKVGYLIQFNMFSVLDSGTALTDYSLNNFSSGITAGLSATPFHMNNGSKLGFYFDVYRGTKIYNDFYNQSIYEMPASSFMKFGIIYQFGKNQSK